MMMLFLVLAIVLLLILGVYLYLIMPSLEKKSEFAEFANYLYAHRGYHDNHSDAPENSLKSFALAVQEGYGMELDIQLSKDGQIVVFHDDTLDRVCGVKGKVSDYTYEELQAFSLLESDAKIPLFWDMLEIVAGKTPLIVEFKTLVKNTPLCEKGDAMLTEYHKQYGGLYCIESFHMSVVEWYKNNRPDVVRGQLACPGLPGVWAHKMMEYLLTNVKTRPHFIAYDHNAKNNISRRLCRSLFKNCAVAWTITSQAEFDACKADFDLYIFEQFAPKV